MICADWVVDERFSGIAARINALPNIKVNCNYGSLNESYRLCAAADLVIAKHTSLVDEVLALGIPCVLHDYTPNSQDLARTAVAYLPRRLWAENPSELRDVVDFVLQDGGAALQDWWEPHRNRLYKNLSDGSVRACAAPNRCLCTVGSVASAIEHFESLDVVQVPASVVDQRLVKSAVLHALNDAGAEIQVRSIFLQGLLLEPRATASLAAHPDIRRFHLFCEANGIAPLTACLSFIKSLEWATQVVVGVTGADELKQVADTWAQVPLTADWAELASSDTALVDPRLWSR